MPRRGTEREVGGMISARSRKNTVRESKMEMESDTCKSETQFKYVINYTTSCIIIVLI